MTRAAALTVIAIALAAVPSAGDEGRIMDVRDRMKEAAGGAAGGGLVLSGTVRQSGLDSGWTLRVAVDGRFVRTIDGVLPDAVGYDGRAGWSRDWTGMPMFMELLDLEIAQTEAWFVSGLWLDRDGLVDILAASDPDSAGDVELSVSQAGARVPMRLVVGPDALPKRIVRGGPAGPETWTFADWTTISGYRVPGRLARAAGGEETTVLTITAVRADPGADSADYGMPAGRPDDVTFAGPDSVTMRRAPTGHVLVHPSVNGEDVGWFILDTGAGQSVISRAAAEKLGLPVLGTIRVASIFGAAPGAVHRAEGVTLGPVTLSPAVFVEMDLAPLEPYFGEPLGGIIGYDLLARSVTEIDLAAGRLAFHDPATFDGAGLAWTRLHLSHHCPTVEAAFDGGTGLFRLDIGASGGAHGNVVFHAPAVKALGLVEGRDVKPVQIATQKAAVGTIDWFELAGRRWDRPEVVFALSEVGPFTDVYTTGNIGNGFMQAFRMIFDYGRARVAFVPAEAGR